MARGLPGGKGPNQQTEFVAQHPLFADTQPPTSCAFVSNAAAPQIANYALIAGLGFFLASAVTPQGQANAAEYAFGTHAQAVHQAEAVKSDVWGSVRTPPAAPLRLLWARQDDSSQTAPVIWRSAPTPPVAASVPLRSLWAAPQQADFTQQAIFAEPGFATGGVPEPTLAAPQADSSQLAAQVWRSASPPPAGAGVTVNPNAPVTPQSDPSANPSTLWPSAATPQGQVGPAQYWFGTHAQVIYEAEGEKTIEVWASVRTPPGTIAPVPLRTTSAGPQFDPSISSTAVWESLFAGKTPPAAPFIQGSQVDPTQVPAQVWSSARTPPAAITGITVSPSTIIPPQADPSGNSSRIWASSAQAQGQANAAQYQFGTHAQALYQAEAVKSALWESIRTPPAPITGPYLLRSLSASPESVDLSISGWSVGGSQANQGPVPPLVFAQQANPWQTPAVIWKSAATPPVAPSSLLGKFIAIPPQSEDREGRAIWRSLVSGQTPPIIPTVSAAPQSDPTQIAAQVQPSVRTPPPILGVTVWSIFTVPPQLDLTPNSTQTWGPGLTPLLPPLPLAVAPTVRNFSLRAWRTWHRPEDERRLRELQLTPAVAEVIVQVAERQAQTLEPVDRKRVAELRRELEIKRLRFQARYLELLNAERQQLIDAEIKSFYDAKQALDEENTRRLLLLLTFLT